jgi:hypothetical protein
MPYFNNANDLIAQYTVRDQPPSDHRILFAAVLMQAKRDIQYAGADGKNRVDAQRWVAQGDRGAISFNMCCEALCIDPGAAKKFLSTPYKERRPWNGRDAKHAAVTPLSARTCSRSRRRSSLPTTMTGSVSYAARPRSSSSTRMTL